MIKLDNGNRGERSLFRSHSGPLTRDLLQQPAGFGLGNLPVVSKPDATTQMVCGYCSTGCNLSVHLKDGEAIGLSPTTDYPVNLGMACPKGWEALSVLDAPDRASQPLLRKSKGGRLEAVDWETALTTFTERMKGIQREHGDDSIAFISTGQVPTEEMALLGALFKFGMRGLHGDGNTRQCMATSVVAYKQAFGFDAPPYTYKDFEESDTIVLIGSNLCLAHPIMWERVMRNPHDPKIIVIDPRRTETAMQATQHLALAPKSDQTLLYAVARVLIANGWIDRDYIQAHTNGFEEFAEFVEAYSLQRAIDETGLAGKEILKLAQSIHDGERVPFWWTMGVNQSYQGVRTAQAIINLALMTGNIGRPGTGANSITGQCNAMGSRLFSNTTNLLGGHDFNNDLHRAKVASVLEIDEDRIPREPSWAYNEIIEGILRGNIKGLWVICTNPAHSWINQNFCRDVLDRLDFLVVQDMYHSTETAQMADLVLPAAGWGEKDGTFINSERRIGVLKKVRQAPGQALADFSIFKLIAHYWGCADMFEKWSSPEAVFQILKQLSSGQPCDITGIEDYRHLDDVGGIQWPARKDEDGKMKDESQSLETHPSSFTLHAGAERRLFEDGVFYHVDGRAKFLFEASRPMPEPPSEQFPFLLITGRGTASQWHTQTRTSKSAVLRKLYPNDIYVEISTTDARRMKIAPHAMVRVESQRGQLRARAFVTPTMKPGQVFIPMHFEAANRLTDAVFDPYSKQPSYKSCAVYVSTESY